MSQLLDDLDSLDDGEEEEEEEGEVHRGRRRHRVELALEGESVAKKPRVGRGGWQQLRGRGLPETVKPASPAPRVRHYDPAEVQVSLSSHYQWQKKLLCLP